MDGALVEGLLRQQLDEKHVKYTYNPYLKGWRNAQPDDTAQKGHIQLPGQTPNIIFQTRSHEPTEYENELGDGLEKVLGEGAESLKQIAEGLNKHNVLGPDGSDWTEESLAVELHRLGAGA